jgi:hypothetical protein
MKLASIILGATLLLPLPLMFGKPSKPLQDNQSDLVMAQDRQLYATQGPSARKTCKEYYKDDEDSFAKAHNCNDTGQSSACGGPDQCSCPSNQRLVQYKCTEGTFNVCAANFPDGSPRCR